MPKTSRPPAMPPDPHPLPHALDTFVFLLPMIVWYEIASFQVQQGIVAFDLLRSLLAWFGPIGSRAPLVLLIVILLATHIVRREPWRISVHAIARMCGESILFALGLILLDRIMRFGGVLSAVESTWMSTSLHAGISIGAGIYEELVFRLMLILLIVVIGVDVMGLRKQTVAIASVIISALMFSAYHHWPLGMEPFTWSAFIFRTMAGAYLSIIFWYRGYGIAAGTHAAYNVAVLSISTLM